MLDEDVYSAFEEVTKPRKKRRIFGAVIGTVLGAIVGAHWYFGFTAKDVEHEMSIYHSRIFEKETLVSLVDADGKQHSISIIGDFPKGYDQLLKGVVATLRSKVVENTPTICFEDTDKLKKGTSAHAHLVYNGGHICIDKKAPVDTWVHEFTHPAFFSVPWGDQIKFASINESFYQKKLIPLRHYPDRWADRKDLPAGENGPAFGFPSRYAAKHPYECASEMMEEMWRFTHPELHNPKDRKSTYVAIFSDRGAHKIQDHKQRYDILVAQGFLTEAMKEKMEDGFAGNFEVLPSTD